MSKSSYSQAGEDCIVSLAFYFFGISKPSYLDIGAHHPTSLSNTYFFYKKGCRGVCVEPDPKYARLFRTKRRHDVFLNAAIGFDDTEEADFYLMKSHALNTLSRDSALAMEKAGEKIARVVKIKLLNVNRVIEQKFPKGVNFVSLDAEGVDIEILKSFCLDKMRPQVFCVETIAFENQEKVPDVTEWMLANDYFVFGETYINTIYVDRQAWERRGS
jgi:FkbM family methyltransferase